MRFADVRPVSTAALRLLGDRLDFVAFDTQSNNRSIRFGLSFDHVIDR